MNGQEIKKPEPIVKSAISNENQIKVLPSEFTVVTVLIINFDIVKDVSLVVKNLEGVIVFKRNLQSVKNTSVKIELSEVPKGEYKVLVFESDKELFNNSIFKL
jgi:hypothetical protein